MRQMRGHGSSTVMGCAATLSSGVHGSGCRDMPDDITLGEVNRRLDRLEGQIHRQFTDLSEQVRRLEFVPRGEHDIALSELEKRFRAETDEMRADIEEFRESRKWFARVFIVSLILPMLVAVLTSVLFAAR
jgi:hypothetical protein